MDRDTLINKILEFSGPVGPFRDYNEYQKSEEVFYKSITLDCFDTLLDILINPPSLEKWNLCVIEDFEFQLIYTLGLAAKTDPHSCLRKIEPLVQDEKIRPFIIEVIGAIKCQEGVPVLESILKEKLLSDDEVIRLSCSLSEIGGLSAQQILSHMTTNFKGRNEKVCFEIENNLKSVSCEQSVLE